MWPERWKRGRTLAIPELIGCYIRWRLSGRTQSFREYFDTRFDTWIDPTIGIAVLVLIVALLYQVRLLWS